MMMNNCTANDMEMIEKWMEKKVTTQEKVTTTVRRKSVTDIERTVFLNSSSSSSDSGSGGLFSSSEPESIHGVPSRQPAYTTHRPKPIRTSISINQPEIKQSEQQRDRIYISPKHEAGGFVKTKSKASKIYSDLKKVKQPISPGGRLASFLNSLFTTTGNAKKAKVSSADKASLERKLTKSGHESSTCSSASSFSRSCLSNTPSSRGKLNSNGMKRSVRFYPVSVIVDEDCQPCGQKSLYEDDERNLQAVKSTVRNSVNEDLKTHLKEKNRRVEEAARDLLKNYQKQVQSDQYGLRNIVNNVHSNREEFDDDDSDASSDLFELDNLSAIGIDRYGEELPVYETTYLDTNRAIANGFIL
ncbi:hypothetical protein LguiA_028812 [Lonicera macranthoides]